MSRRTGPTVRGVCRDGRPRVFVGRKPKLAEARPVASRLLTLPDQDRGGFVSVSTAEQTRLYPIAGGLFPGVGLSSEQLDRIDVQLDYFDAANEDAHGRLPHDPGYGSRLVLVPALPPEPVELRRAA